MNKRMFCVFGLVFPLVGASAVQAQVQVDVSKITCEQFLLFKVADPRDIGIWLSGYLHGRSGTTIVDTQALKEYSEKLNSYCRGHLQQPVMQAVETLVKPAKSAQ